MEDTLTKLVLNIDKSAWQPVKFGEVAFEPKETCKDIIGEGIEHVVGLEHIITGDIRLRHSATIEESTTFSKKFQAGDVLFGRRRAYLKKAAQACFGGICSGDITVFRAKGNLLPELLPFIVSNDKFFDYAIKHSAGGLSPRVKFKDLANYEFLLPPKEQQAQLAELLWAMDEVIEREMLVLEKLNFLNVIKREELLNRGVDGPIVSLGDISKLQGGATFTSTDSSKIGAKWLKIANVGFNEIKWEEQSFLPLNFILDYPDFVLNEGDIVLALTRPVIGNRLKVARIERRDEGSLLNQRVGRIIIKGEIQTEFLYEHLKSNSFLMALVKELQGTDPPNISNKMYENYKLILPDHDTQHRIQKILGSISANSNLFKNNIKKSKSLQKSLINQIF